MEGRAPTHGTYNLLQVAPQHPATSPVSRQRSRTLRLKDLSLVVEADLPDTTLTRRAGQRGRSRASRRAL